MQKSKVNPDHHIVIHGWMVTDLELSGNNLIVFAYIYGYTQDREHWCNCSLSYLADWCHCTTRGIQKNINNLLDMGLIEKESYLQNCVTFCRYRIADIWSSEGIEQSSILTNSEIGGIEQSSRGIEQSSRGIEQSSLYILSNNHTSKLGDNSLLDNRKVERRENSKQKQTTFVKSSNDYEWVKDLFNKTCPSLFHVNKMNAERVRLAKRLLKNVDKTTLHEVFKKCEQSKFLRDSKNEKWFSLEWILTEKNFEKIKNGNYDKDFTQKPKSVEARYNPKMSAKGSYRTDSMISG